MNNLRFVNVSDNMIQTISPQIFSNESNLQTFDARQNTMYKVTHDSFKIPQNATFIVDKYATCCFMEEEQCLSLEPRPEYLTCNRMLRDVFLRISVWVLALSAFLCNGVERNSIFCSLSQTRSKKSPDTANITPRVV